MEAEPLPSPVAPRALLTNVNGLRLSPEIWTLLGAFFATVLAYRVWNRHKLPPIINPSKLFDFGHAAAKQDFVLRTEEIMDEAEKKFGEKPYTVMTDAGRVIMLSLKYVDELRNEPKLTFLEGQAEDHHAHLPGFEPFGDQIIVSLAKKQLTKYLTKVTKPLSDETAFAVKTVLGDSDDWQDIVFGPKVLNMVSRLSSRVFLGPEICRNESWLNICVMYVVDGFTGCDELRLYPAPLRRIVNQFLPVCRRLRGYVAEVQDIMKPVIEARARERQAAIGKGLPPPVYDDAIQWVAEEAGDRKHDPAVVQLALVMTAVHTTTDLVGQVLVYLMTRPELVAALRAEMVDVLGREGWAKTSLYNLKLLDSVMKETQRLKPIASISMIRVATSDLTLSDGTVVPTGTRLAVKNTSRLDPTVYENPSEFDGYRFLRMRTMPGKEAQANFVTTGQNALGFGHGKHACPGRFFAANEVKILLCHILLKYDMELTPDSDDSVQVYGFNLLSNRDLKMKVRRRTPEIDVDSL